MHIEEKRKKSRLHSDRHFSGRLNHLQYPEPDRGSGTSSQKHSNMRREINGGIK